MYFEFLGFEDNILSCELAIGLQFQVDHVLRTLAEAVKPSIDAI